MPASRCPFSGWVVPAQRIICGGNGKQVVGRYPAPLLNRRSVLVLAVLPLEEPRITVSCRRPATADWADVNHYAAGTGAAAIRLAVRRTGLCGRQRRPEWSGCRTETTGFQRRWLGRLMAIPAAVSLAFAVTVSATRRMRRSWTRFDSWRGRWYWDAGARRQAATKMAAMHSTRSSPGGLSNLAAQKKAGPPSPTHHPPLRKPPPRREVPAAASPTTRITRAGRMMR
jgi:hypothetical protein